MHYLISFLFCINHFCSDYRFQRCGLTCCFFVQYLCSLCFSIRTHSGFMVSSLFSFKNIRLSIALFLLRFVILLTLIGSKTTQSWVCCISVCASAITFSTIFLCLVSSCTFSESCKISCCTFQLSHY